MSSIVKQATRRRVLGAGAPLGTALLAACGETGGQPASRPDATPQEVLWGTYAPPSDVRAGMLKEMWQMAEQAAGVKLTVVEEGGGIAWEKRQTELTAGNAWSIVQLSKAKDAAWKALTWIHSKEGMLSPQIKAVAWPPLTWAADDPQWKDQFKGTKIAEVSKVWDTSGHDLLVLPDATNAWPLMSPSPATTPLGRALTGQISTKDAMQESARPVNDLFSRRPPNWK